MADYDDTEDTLDEEQDLDTDSQESDTGATSDDAPPASQDSSDTESKRIADLTSKWQKAEARAAKAEKAAIARAAKGPAQSNPQADEFMDFAKEHARNTLYASDPRFSEYGVAVEDIAGDSPAEMRASMERQRKLVDSLESKIRNKVMREHGLDPEVTNASGGSNTPDFASMSSEDFLKFMERRDRLR